MHAQQPVIVEALEDRIIFSTAPVPAFLGALPRALPPGGQNHVAIHVPSALKKTALVTVDVRLFASTDLTLDANDVPLATFSKTGRVGRGGVNVPIRFASPETVAAGNYYLLAEVDGSSGIVTGTAITKKTTFLQPPVANLAIVSTTLPDRPVEINGYSSGQRTVRAKITNTGNVTVSTAGSVSFYLSTDSLLDSSDALLGTAKPTPAGLHPGKSTSVGTRVAVPPGTAVGGYFVFAVYTPASAAITATPANDVAISTNRMAVVDHLPPRPRIKYVTIYYDGPDYYYDDDNGNYEYDDAYVAVPDVPVDDGDVPINNPVIDDGTLPVPDNSDGFNTTVPDNTPANGDTSVPDNTVLDTSQPTTTPSDEYAPSDPDNSDSNGGSVDPGVSDDYGGAAYSGDSSDSGDSGDDASGSSDDSGSSYSDNSSGDDDTDSVHHITSKTPPRNAPATHAVIAGKTSTPKVTLAIHATAAGGHA